MSLGRIIVVVLYLSLFSSGFVFSSYLIYPRLESGNNSLDLYDSFLTDLLERRVYFSSFVFSDFSSSLDYGYLLGLNMDEYGELSFSYIERELGISRGSRGYKESAYNISYRYRFSIVGLLFGVNISDPYHGRFFEFGDDFLYSFNIGLTLRPTNFLFMELGVFNIAKGLSLDVLDLGERFYSSVYMFILDDLLLKVSFHVFKGHRIMGNMFLSYFINRYVSVDFVFSSDPMSFLLSTRFSIYLFSLKLAGIVRGGDFHAFMSLGFAWGSSSSGFKGMVNLGDRGSGGVSAYLVNINRADEDELILLPGIGRGLSKRIVEYRDLYGLFYSKSELMRVEGIGMKSFNRLKDLITVGSVDFAMRLSRLIRWSMKDFIEIGFSPFLSLGLVIYIDENYPFDDLGFLFGVEGFRGEHLEKLRLKLEEYGYKGN